ncbi:gamma-glutamylcyclotransferase family protein [Marinobacter sp. CHS3-4]|uniref:gamma-glutamylcyclotransferase family protein n=1 Tax=Marinobacter sp. CHS3-4 TaxID=3045174 RepID=UPI0024B615EE|nr:gamma-glutamylcyclotransferase family protein [Marinobacter sp. CHS3-4]MDI9245972.1 gamma-glutamylcyclotransferase family protein [Marinobacter sp. CHS3-4]
MGTNKVKANLRRVAVYGTLKKGQSNHQILAGALYVGHCQLNQITLYDIGPYPGAKLRSSDGVDVEVYDVNAETFDRLDELEDYNAQAPALGLYDRRELETSFGAAWIYLYNPDVSGLDEIISGGWPRQIGGL